MIKLERQSKGYFYRLCKRRNNYEEYVIPAYKLIDGKFIRWPEADSFDDDWESSVQTFKVLTNGHST